MTGQFELGVYLDKKQIATLSATQDQLRWQYQDDWRENGFAVSPHLPLNQAIPSEHVTRYLKNLLPEDKWLVELANQFQISKTNTFGLVRALGQDLSGALLFLNDPTSLKEATHFRKITSKELEKKLNDRNSINIINWDGKPRLSVAGVQDKINVVVNNKELGFGEGDLCSTHLLKFEKTKKSYLVLNEFISMTLAKQCGLSVANIQIEKFGEHRALLVERFDRKWISDSEVARRHVIDGCQALNLSPDYKYERPLGNNRDVAQIRDGASLEKLFAFANLCNNPAQTKQQILDWVLFNLMIANVDAHGKNISFFVNQRGIQLAPFYDLVNIGIYEKDYEQELAMALGDDFESKKITAYQLFELGERCGLAKTLIRNRLELLISKFEAIKENALAPVKLASEKKFIHAYLEFVTKRCKNLTRQTVLMMELKF